MISKCVCACGDSQSLGDVQVSRKLSDRSPVILFLVAAFLCSRNCNCKKERHMLELKPEYHSPRTARESARMS